MEVFMKKNLAAIVSSLIVLGSVNPVFAAVKNVYTDADSGFSMQTADPHFEYASRNSYGFQEAKSATNTINSVLHFRFRPGAPAEQEIGRAHV